MSSVTDRDQSTAECGQALPGTRAAQHSPTSPARVRCLVLAAAIACAASLGVASVVGGAADASVVSDPGVLSRWGLLVMRTVYDITAMATIGVLVVAVVLLRPTAGVLSCESERLVLLAGRWSAVWAAAGALSVPLVISDMTGMPVWKVLAPDVLSLAADVPQTQALLSSAWLAVVVTIGSRRCRSPVLGALILVIGIAALLPLLLTGHTGHGDQHDIAVAGLAAHVTAAAVWAGGLLALGVHLRSAGTLVLALPRYSRVALACFTAVALSGLLMGWVSLAEPRELVTTPYGQLLLGKTAALGVLGAFGHWHRRRTVVAVGAGRPQAFLSLAAVELVVMAATVALAVGLSRTAPPDAGDHAAAAMSATADAHGIRPVESPTS